MSFDGLTLAVFAVFLVVLFTVVWIGLGVTRAQEDMSQKLALYGRTSTASLREDELSKPLAQRTIGPVVLRISNFLKRFTPIGYLDKKQHQLILAGSPGNMDAPSLVVIKMLGTIVGVVLGFFLIDYGASGVQRVVLFVMPIALGFFGPDAWLARKIDERKDSMQKALPDVLDLLVISVEAGLGFDSALSRVVATVPGPLSEEFFRMLQETRVGVSRRDAMRHLMDRTDLDELRSFLLAMIQAEAFGVTIANVLRVQADEMRVKRRQRAQEKAFAAPVKLVFPLVFCIFPALFIVLLGPAAIQIADAFSR
ncbi:MAG: type II secretion system F family protein [Acidimicrobiia bacterium]|nr:type II secretion system F family protein [Acidimicrobiia bacterium]MDH3464245.1 type II secretion system F family protein [Acidimicrobiia bacterium]